MSIGKNLACWVRSGLGVYWTGLAWFDLRRNGFGGSR